MTAQRKQQILILALSLFLLLSTRMVPAVAAGEQAKTGGSIHERVAGMSDEEARKLLITQLQEQSSTAKQIVTDEALGPGAAFGTLLRVLGQQSDNSQNKLRELADNIPNILPDLRRVFVSLCPYGTTHGALKNVLWVLFFIGLGLTAEKSVNWFLLKKYYHLTSGNLGNIPASGSDISISEKCTAGLVTSIPAVLGLFVFFVIAYLSYFTFIWTDISFLKLLFLAVLLTITIIRLIAILTAIILSPSFRQFRALPLSCVVAGFSYRLIVWTWGYIVTALMFSGVLHRLGARIETVTLINLLAATVLLAVTAAAVIFYRKPVTAYILAPTPEETGPPSWGKQNFASIWHLLTLLYLFILWCLMIGSVADPDVRVKGAFIGSFFVLPIWVAADQVIQWLVKYTMLSLKLYEESSDSQQTAGQEAISQHHKGSELLLKVKLYARLALVMALGLWVASLWGYTIPFVSNLSGVLFDSLIIMTLALLFWQFISSLIERKIKESLPEKAIARDDADDEWGTAKAQGRAYTLLPIIRSFVAAILVVMVTLTILSSMGVDIGPLLAGAGVVGLAVGFGAQKIVSDIFSGIFYLLDDAFRVGEYLSAGSITGTVESISLRNVMLRHHRGMLQIVPHSELGSITNYMRGGIIEKFSLDFAYDADIEKIRKIIKRVGLEMLEDPEIGKDFLRPIRSQGVKQITNSVMTIRVKFTAKPGAQFVIRREAFKRITAAMQAKGIQYAHKKVIVDLPVPIAGYEDTAQREKIVQAAGAAAREIFDEEGKLKQQLAQHKPGA